MNLFEYSRQQREKALADAEGGGATSTPAPPPAGGLTMSQSDFFKQPAKSPEAEAKSQKAKADMLRKRDY